MHETRQEAIDETLRMLNIYADFFENELAIPVIRGEKTPSDKFAGAENTYCIEAMMHDGKALQAGTSHFFGDGFAKAFDITYTDRNNTLRHPFQTSWGVSTRMIGGIIMTHGDNNGLVLPPAVAPIQVVVIPVAAHKPGVIESARALADRLSARFRVKLDDSDQSPGWKYAQYEMKGVPLRIELGPRDIEGGVCVTVTRHNREKIVASLDNIEDTVAERLEELRSGLYEKALANREARTYSCKSTDEIKEVLSSGRDGFIKAMWCGDEACEKRVKELCGVGSRCVPFNQEHISDVCVCCSKPAKLQVLWGVAY